MNLQDKLNALLLGLLQLQEQQEQNRKRGQELETAIGNQRAVIQAVQKLIDEQQAAAAAAASPSQATDAPVAAAQDPA